MHTQPFQIVLGNICIDWFHPATLSQLYNINNLGLDSGSIHGFIQACLCSGTTSLPNTSKSPLKNKQWHLVFDGGNMTESIFKWTSTVIQTEQILISVPLIINRKPFICVSHFPDLKDSDRTIKFQGLLWCLWTSITCTGCKTGKRRKPHDLSSANVVGRVLRLNISKYSYSSSSASSGMGAAVTA